MKNQNLFSKVFSKISLTLFALLVIPIQNSFADNVGVWNGFLDQVNVIELSNPVDKQINIKLEIFDNSSKLINQNSYTLRARESKQITLSNAQIRDSYGTFSITSSDTDLEIPALTSIYRYSRADGSVQYAYAIESSTGVNALSYGLFNSLNPESTSKSIYNYLSVVNTSDKPFSATILLYDQTGQKFAGSGFRVNNLLPKTRKDIDFTNITGVKNGLYKIVPDNFEQTYSADLYRFSQRENGEFNFAFPLKSQKSTCNITSIPVSTMDPAQNWLEVSNTSSNPTSFTFEVFDQTGKLRKTENRTLAGNSQTHYFINGIIGERNSGLANIKCAGNKPNLIAQSLYYGRSSAETNLINWAYASQVASKTSPQEAKIFFVDRRFNAANWLKNTAYRKSGNFQTYSFARSGDLKAFNYYNLNGNSSIDLAFHQQNLQGFFNSQSGTILGVSNYSSVTQPGLLRVYTDKTGKVSAIMNVPGIIVEGDNYTDAFSDVNIYTENPNIEYTPCKYEESDDDGDGWGWENNQSCKVVDTSVSSTSEAICNDPDGDGWGWNGIESCQVEKTDSTEIITTVDNTTDSNSTQSKDEEVVVVEPEGSTCLDPDGDGTGWDPIKKEICEAEAFIPETSAAVAGYNYTECGDEGDWREINYGNYTLQHNIWNQSAMYRKDYNLCVHLDGNSAKPIASWNYNFHGRNDRKENAVIAYPEVYYGQKRSMPEPSAPKSVTHLPERIYNLKDYKVEYKYYENTIGERNVALESFFYTSCEVQTQSTKKYEMMVWLDRPTTQQPGGFNDKLGEARIDGADWEVWTNSTLSWSYIAYVRKTPSKEGTLNWKKFVDFTVKEAHNFGLEKLESNTCMNGIEFGTEIFYGQGDFVLEKFKVTPQ